MCIWCGGYVIVDEGIMICRCDGACKKLSAYLTSHICEKCEASAMEGGGGRCYDLREIRAFTERDKHCKAIIREMTIVWVGTCDDFMFMSKPYVNRLYFRSKFTRRLRKHFGYNVRMSLHRVPFEQVTTFIRCIQHYNSIALADALEGVFSKIFTDIMLSEEGFPRPRYGDMVFCSDRDDKRWLAHDSLRMLRW